MALNIATGQTRRRNEVIDELVRYIVETSIASSELVLTNVGFVGNSC